MTFELILVFIILIGALIIFILDIFPIDFVAFLIMALMLLLSPVIKVRPEEAISGFSNPATITVLAMFILSGGIDRTGMINRLARYLTRLAGKNEIRQLVIIMVTIGVISAFINNTAAVAILIPSIITLARVHKQAPSKLLIPLSFFSQLAGGITLIGTSTNILASELSAQSGYGGFKMFDFAPIGLLIFMTGALYFLLIGRKLLPDRRTTTEITADYDMRDYLSEVIVLPKSILIGKTVVESRLREQADIHVLEILRDGQKLPHPLADHPIQAQDILFVKANSRQLLKIRQIKGLAIEPATRFAAPDLKSDQRGVLEVVIGPNSTLIGGTLASTNFRHQYGCAVIAIRTHGTDGSMQIIQERLSEVALHFGDILLLRGASSALDQIKREVGFIVTEEIEAETLRTEKGPLAIAIVAGVVIVAAMGQPILMTALVGCVMMVLTGCLKMNELHEAIRWDVIFLLAGVIPLGLAMERTGGVEFLAQAIEQAATHISPLWVLSLFYLLTMFLTGLISNTATIVVMVPVGLATAEGLGLNPSAFVLTIMFAASTSFFTPVGYQTNMMIYGPGGYKFLDFTKVGLPLNILLAVTTPLYIYLLWGL